MDFDNTSETITPIKQSALTIGGVAGINTPQGTTAERPSTPADGVIRYNTESAAFEGYENGSWIRFSGINNVNSAPYRSLTNSQTASDPGSGRIKWNNSTQVNSSQIYISSITNDGVDITQFLLKVQIGSILWIQQSGNSNNYQRWSLNAITNNTGWFTFSVSLLDSFNAQFSNNTNLVVAITSTGSGVVNSFSAGTTGLTPNTPVTGAVTLGGVLNAVNGGTGLNTFAIGDLIVANTTTTFSRLADVATGNALISGGINTLPVWGKIGLTTHVSGILPVANGGTGLSAAPANGQIDIGNGTGFTRATLTAGSGISITNGAGSITISSTGGSGTVTSVGLSLPSIFTVTGSPVTTTGTLTGTLNTQANNTVLAGPVSGGPSVPAFRQLSLIGNDILDVVVTSPQANQVLAYNSGTSTWVNTGAVGANATGNVGVSPSGGGTAWTLISGNSYRADFVHNLGTTNVVVTCWDTNTNAIVIPNNVVTLSNTTVRITVTGNTRTIKVVVVANGQSIVAGGSTPSSVITAINGVNVSTAATRLNFQGQSVGVTDAGGGTTNITIGARFSYFANSLDSPNTADYAVNALAPVTTDPTFTSLNVRSFSNSTEQGVACAISIPSNSTQMRVNIRGRAQTAPGVASVVQPRLYYRLLPNNAAVGAWSAAQEFANISIPTNANFQYNTQTFTLATLGLVAGSLYQFEVTRRVAGVTGTNLAANFLMAEITFEFF